MLYSLKSLFLSSFFSIHPVYTLGELKKNKLKKASYDYDSRLLCVRGSARLAKAGAENFPAEAKCFRSFPVNSSPHFPTAAAPSPHHRIKAVISQSVATLR